MIIALPFMALLKGFGGSLLAGALSFLSPIGAMFRSAKAVLIMILVAAILIGGGYLYNKRMNRQDAIATTAVQVATDAAKTNADNIKTLQMSHEIDTKALDRNEEAKADIVTKAETVTTTKRAAIRKIQKKKEVDVAAAVTPEAKAEVERVAAVEVSRVQVTSMWKSYCNALAAGSPPDARCSAYV